MSKWAPPKPREGPTEGDRANAAEAMLAGISRNRERRVQVEELVRQGDPAHAKRLANCRRQSAELECSDCGGQNYVPVTCKSRLCEDCGHDRMGQLIGDYTPKVAKWGRPALLTLTIPNVSDPAAGKERVQDAFARFRRRVVPPAGSSRTGNKTWAWRLSDLEGPVTDPWRTQVIRGRGREFAARLEVDYVREGRGIPMSELIGGGLYGIDIKQQEQGRFHVHIHALVDMTWTPQPALAEVWRDVTGTDGPAGEVVDVRRVRGGDRDAVENGLAEVVGYVAKPPEFESVETEVSAVLALKGSRLIQPFGSLHGVAVESMAWLECGHCGFIPEQWRYNGIVDMLPDELEVSTGEADRPPPTASIGADTDPAG